MNTFKIVADSACDITKAEEKLWDIKILNLTYTFGDGKELDRTSFKSAEFYKRLKCGECAKTSAVNILTYSREFSKILSDGYDILYVGFSSGLSSTFSNARAAAEQLKAEFPERNIICVDSLCASAGYALLLYLTAKKRDENSSLFDTAEYAERIKNNICHFFTVDDLSYLKRGGRISGTAAFVGAILGIKPILHCDKFGKLTYLYKVRGRKNSLEELANKIGEYTLNDSAPVFICHGDCKDDAETLKKMIQNKYGIKVKFTAEIGPVIGAHSGPGAISVFFVGKER